MAHKEHIRVSEDDKQTLEELKRNEYEPVGEVVSRLIERIDA